MNEKRVWKAAKRCLFPGWRVTLPVVVVSAAALIFLFRNGYEETPVAYVVYPVSFYGLVAGTAAVIRTGRRIWARVRAIPLVEHWRRDAYWRVRMGLAVSLLVNLCYGGLRVVGAVLYASFWEGALGGYYLLLCAVRIFLIRRMPVSSAPPDHRKELRTCRCAGWLLIGLDLALVGISVQIVQDGQGYEYPGTLIYGAAAYSFYCLTMAIINGVRYRKFHSPVLSAAKAVSLTTALVSIFSLETAMLSQFGGGARFRFWMTAATAAAVCALVLFFAAQMVYRSGRRLKQLEEERA